MADTNVRPVEVVRELYSCFEQRDVEGALALLDPEITVTQDPSLPWGGTYRGIDSAVTQLAMFEAGDTVVLETRFGEEERSFELRLTESQ